MNYHKFFIGIFYIVPLWNNAMELVNSDQQARPLIFTKKVPSLCSIAATAHAKTMVSEYQLFGVDDTATADVSADIEHKLHILKEHVQELRSAADVQQLLTPHVFDTFFERNVLQGAGKTNGSTRKKKWKYNLKVQDQRALFCEDGILTFERDDRFIRKNEESKTIVCSDYAISNDEKKAIIVFNPKQGEKPTFRIIGSVTESLTSPYREIPHAKENEKVFLKAFGSLFLEYVIAHGAPMARKIFHALDDSLTCVALDNEHNQESSPKIQCCHDFKVTTDGTVIYTVVLDQNNEQRRFQIQRFSWLAEQKSWLQEDITALAYMPSSADRIILDDVKDDALLYTVLWLYDDGSVADSKKVLQVDGKIFVTNNPQRNRLSQQELTNNNQVSVCEDFKMNIEGTAALLLSRSKESYPLINIYTTYAIDQNVGELWLPYTFPQDQVQLYEYNDNWISYGIRYQRQFPQSDKFLKILLASDQSLCIKTRPIERIGGSDNQIMPDDNVTYSMECDDFLVSDDGKSVALLQYSENYPDEKTCIEVIGKTWETTREGEAIEVWKMINRLTVPGYNSLKLEKLNNTHVLYSLQKRCAGDDLGGCLEVKKRGNRFGKRFRMMSLDSGTILYDRFLASGQPQIPTFHNSALPTHVALSDILGNVAYINIKQKIARQSKGLERCDEEKINQQLDNCKAIIASDDTRHKVSLTQECLKKIYARDSFLTKMRIWARRYRNYIKPVMYGCFWSSWSNALLGLNLNNSTTYAGIKIALGFALSYPFSRYLDQFLMCGDWQKSDQKWWNKQK